MKNLRLQLAVVLLSTLCLLTGAFGQITPLGDTYTNSADPTTNYGAQKTLDVDAAKEITYIQFNLASVPTGASISQATLKLYVNTVVTAGAFELYAVNGAWTESALTYSLAPALGSVIDSNVPITTADKNQFILIPMTSTVQGWLTTPSSNNGIALVAVGSFDATFDSKETTTTSHPPELDIVFAGDGTITGVTTASGSGLTGGGTSGTLNLSLTNSCAANQVLQYNGSAWTCAAVGTGTVTSVGSGTGLTGGPITGSGTLSLAANACASGSALSALPFTCSPFATLGANTFTGNQTVSGNLSATGVVTGSGYQIGSNLFDFGSYANGNAFLGFAGNTTMTGTQNTASGYQALISNTAGSYNTASGYAALASNGLGVDNSAFGDSALLFNTTGDNNTAVGYYAMSNNRNGNANTAIGLQALDTNTVGSQNTAIGFTAGFTLDASNLTGNNNTALGYYANFSTGTLTNATAIGALAEVTESNAMVLGSIYGVNFATASTNVGIGTTAPGHLLDVAGTTAIDSTGLNNGTNFIDLTFGANAGEGMSSSRTAGPNQYGIDIFTDFARRISIEQHGNVGIGTTSPDNLLTVNGSADKPGGGSWGTYSDGRLKNLNGSFNSGLSQILRINPIRYRYKADNALGIRDTDEHIGVVAQDVQRVIPEAVTENSKGYLLVNNDPIIWSMLNAIKEQQGEIRALKSELRATRQTLQKVQTQMARSQPALVAAK
jgi:hypothetical protein